MINPMIPFLACVLAWFLLVNLTADHGPRWLHITMCILPLWIPFAVLAFFMVAEVVNPPIY